MLQYVINVLYTKIGAPFEAWVKTQVDAHHEEQKKDQVIEMDADVARAFRASTAVSSKFLTAT